MMQLNAKKIQKMLQNDGTSQPIGYWWQTLTKAEEKLAAPHKEWLAVVQVVMLLQVYLRTGLFIISSDHVAIQWLLNLADISNKLARWRLQLCVFDFEVIHRACMKHQTPIALPALNTEGTDKIILGEELPVLTIDEIKKKADVEIKYFDGDQSCKEQNLEPF